VGGGDDFVVAQGAAGLDHGGGAGFGREILRYAQNDTRAEEYAQQRKSTEPDDFWPQLGERRM
jgi:hypothetical protein